MVRAWQQGVHLLGPPLSPSLWVSLVGEVCCEEEEEKQALWAENVECWDGFPTPCFSSLGSVTGPTLGEGVLNLIGCCRDEVGVR